MIEVVGIKFINNGTIYNFNPDNHKYEKGQNVIVETELGLQFAEVIKTNNDVPKEKLFLPLKKVIRLANSKDLKTNQDNINEAKEALNECKKLVEKENLNMKLLSSMYTFDRNQLIFYFTADKRIDFRNLVKELAKKYRTRIEMRQIGARDKAKELGGIGPCGQVLCCKKFLNDFDSISINMAKNQGIALNPTKINGSCGRLFCCLQYEDCQYEEARKGMPTLYKNIDTEYGVGKVISIDYLNRKYKIDINGQIYEIECK